MRLAPAHQRATSDDVITHAKKLQAEARHREDKLTTSINRARSKRQDTSQLERRLDRVHHDYETATTHLLHVEGHHQSLKDGEEGRQLFSLSLSLIESGSLYPLIGDRLRNDVHTRQNELDSARDRHHQEQSTESNDHLTQSEAKLKEAEQHQDAHHQSMYDVCETTQAHACFRQNSTRSTSSRKSISRRFRILMVILLTI